MNIRVWIQAARLRTLPLAVSGIIAGSAGAVLHQAFDGTVFLLSLLTAVMLQVLSNYANDLGDYENGADHAGRIGPARAVQSGIITPGGMKLAVIIFSVLSFASGVCLLITAGVFADFNKGVFYIMLGLGCIAAAITYTFGKRAYGYSGWGDFFVGLFFGPVSVYGSFYIYTGVHDLLMLLPAAMVGSWSVAVLNLNNMRDVDSDTIAGKKTLPVRHGIRWAKAYHVVLMAVPVVVWCVFSFMVIDGQVRWLWIIPGLIIIKMVRQILSVSTPSSFDPYLKYTALLTFFSSLLLLLSSFL